VKGFTAAATLRKVARMVKAFILIVEWAGTEHESDWSRRNDGVY
jgi:hypothetical protein